MTVRDKVDQFKNKRSNWTSY